MVSIGFAIILIMGDSFVPASYSFASEQSCKDFGNKWVAGASGWWDGKRGYQCIPLKIGEPFAQQPAEAK